MAGGLFGRPLVFNEKCIFFSLICMMLYLYKPSYENKFVLYLTLFVIFVVAYVAMAWYDYYFNCDLIRFKRGTHSLTGLFKPPHDGEKKKYEGEEKEKVEISRKQILIYLAHILFIVPLILYVAYYKNKVNAYVYPTLVVLAVFTLLYHSSGLLYMI